MTTQHPHSETTSSSLRMRLREETREAHQQLDKAVGSLNPFTTETGYVAYLTGMYGIYEVFGETMDRASELAELSQISKALQKCIADDLESVPLSQPAPIKPQTDADIWAAAYVLEGASMGARHIVKQLTASETVKRISFLGRLAEGSGKRWPTFIAALEASSGGQPPSGGRQSSGGRGSRRAETSPNPGGQGSRRAAKQGDGSKPSDDSDTGSAGASPSRNASHGGSAGASPSREYADETVEAAKRVFEVAYEIFQRAANDCSSPGGRGSRRATQQGDGSKPSDDPETGSAGASPSRNASYSGSAGASPSQGAATVGSAGALPSRKHPVHGVLDIQDQTTIVAVTVCTRDRAPWLANDDVHRLLRDIWQSADLWRVGRYVIMPDHIHLFAGECGDIPLDNWIRYWKSQFTKQWPQAVSGWQTDHWDRRVRSESEYEDAWNYVYHNPVRAGLVAHPDEWQYGGEVNELRWN